MSGSTTLSGPLLSPLKRGTVMLQTRASSAADIPYRLFDLFVHRLKTRWFLSAQPAFFSFELCHGHNPEPEVQGGQVRTPCPPRVLGQAADDFLPNLLFSQLLALIVVCTVAPSCWNSRSHISQGSGVHLCSSSTFIRSFHVSFHVEIKRQDFQ